MTTSRAVCAFLAAALLSGCGIRQAVYVPSGWQRTEQDTFELRKDDLVASMPMMVVNKSDVTLHPAVSMHSKGHEVRLVSASWTVAGQPLAPYSRIDPAAPVDGSVPLDLHWTAPNRGKVVDVLSQGTPLRIDVTVDGTPEVIDIDFVRRDRY
jgi:hypothetical protein